MAFQPGRGGGAPFAGGRGGACQLHAVHLGGGAERAEGQNVRRLGGLDPAARGRGAEPYAPTLALSAALPSTGFCKNLHGAPRGSSAISSIFHGFLIGLLVAEKFHFYCSKSA